MNDPYRASVHCGLHHTATVACPSCGTTRCVRCMERGVCETCVEHALEALHARADAAPRPTPSTHHARRRALVAVALGSALLGIVSATSAALASMHYIDHVQLRALSSPQRTRRHARPRFVPAVSLDAPTPQPAAVPPTPIAAPLPEPTVLGGPASILVNAGPVTHDPAHLVARARRLADAGADVIVMSLRLPISTLDRAVQSVLTSTSDARFTPLYHDGRPDGLRIDAARGPLLAIAGLRDGDVLTAVNGYPLPTTDESAGPWDRMTRERMFVAELVRESHRVVLVVSWPDDRTFEARDVRESTVHEATGAPSLHSGNTRTSVHSTAVRARRSHEHGNVETTRTRRNGA